MSKNVSLRLRMSTSSCRNVGRDRTANNEVCLVATRLFFPFFFFGSCSSSIFIYLAVIKRCGGKKKGREPKTLGREWESHYRIVNETSNRESMKRHKRIDNGPAHLGWISFSKWIVLAYHQSRHQDCVRIFFRHYKTIEGRTNKKKKWVKNNKKFDKENCDEEHIKTGAKKLLFHLFQYQVFLVRFLVCISLLFVRVFSLSLVVRSLGKSVFFLWVFFLLLLLLWSDVFVRSWSAFILLSSSFYGFSSSTCY